MNRIMALVASRCLLFILLSLLPRWNGCNNGVDGKEVPVTKSEIIIQGFCPNGWQRFVDSCYKRFHKPKITWDEAREFCLRQRSDLVCIQSQDEQSFVYKTYRCGESIWIGLRKVLRDYIWVNGDNMEYQYWATGIAGNPGKEQCVEIVDYGRYRGKWSDIKCDAKRNYFICERGTRQGAFYRIIPKTRLKGHVISKHDTYSEMECAMRCQHTEDCVSVNFKRNSQSQHKQEWTKGTCELNSASIKDCSKDCANMPNFDYLEMIMVD